jgi:16S rRNA (cytosine1402-N4)-methyltransferase
VLAYHSLEDRLVKQVLGLAARDRAPRDMPVVPAELQPQLRLLTRGAMRPKAAEIARNPRAASARLRAAERIAEMAVAA